MSKPTVKQIAIAVNQIVDEGTLSSQQISSIVAAYLVEEKRTRDLDAVLRTTSKLRANNGIIEASVRSAFPIDAEVRAKLESIIKKEYVNVSRIILNEIRDDLVVGGVKLDSSEIRLDASIQGKLQHLTTVNDKA